jgi:molybdenum cofactor biosynthesis enzyme MoaA
MEVTDLWRQRKCAAFDPASNGSAGRTVVLDLWGRRLAIYANANLSIYSAQACNARCPFCVEELRPASRGVRLTAQKTVEPVDERYFAALRATLTALRPLDPSVSVTGGEASKDPRLPRILRTIARHGARKRTLTTNGSGLLDVREGLPVIDWITATGVRHLNISRAHPDEARNGRIMRLPGQLPVESLREVVARARAGGTRVRLSCVLLDEGIRDLEGILSYIDFARSLGADNVVFRQLMKTDPDAHAASSVVRYSDAQRVSLEPLLDAISRDRRFAFECQIVGYYYYVEVWRAGGADIVFEEADLAQLERAKRLMPAVVHELVFHPNARLASTWQPWDGVLGPPAHRRSRRGHCDALWPGCPPFTHDRGWRG